MIQKPFRGVQLNRTHPLAKGLNGCWLFNEATGETVFDSSGHSNNGTLENGVAWGSGGLEFDGVDDYVTITDDAFSTHNTTSISLWFYEPNALTYGYANQLFSVKEGTDNQDTFVLGHYHSSGRTGIRLSLKVGLTWVFDGTSGSVLESQKWHHIVAIIGDTDGTHVYIDGIENTNLHFTDTSGLDEIADATQKNFIGIEWYNNAFGHPHEGFIDSVRIYNRALSVEEVMWSYREPYAMFDKYVSPALLYAAAAAGVPNAGALMMSMI